MEYHNEHTVQRSIIYEWNDEEANERTMHRWYEIHVTFSIARKPTQNNFV